MRRWTVAEAPRRPYSRRGEVRKGRGAQRLKAFQLRDTGVATAAIARQLVVPRSTVRSWFQRRAGVAQSAEAAGLNPAQWGFESLHQHQRPSYAYVLGMYLGDGYVGRTARTRVLRIFLNRRHQDVIARVEVAIRTSFRSAASPE
jgi:Homeodomain-like domain